MAPGRGFAQGSLNFLEDELLYTLARCYNTPADQAETAQGAVNYRPAASRRGGYASEALIDVVDTIPRKMRALILDAPDDYIRSLIFSHARIRRWYVAGWKYLRGLGILYVDAGGGPEGGAERVKDDPDPTLAK
jgi:hypothetical protein